MIIDLLLEYPEALGVVFFGALFWLAVNDKRRERDG